LLQEALFETYGRNRARIINAGLCGDTATGALARLEEDALRFQPDLVIIGFGLNDAGSEASLPAFESSMRELISRARESGAEVLLRTPNPIVVSNQPSQPPAHRPGREWPGTVVGLFARKIVELGEELGCPVVDHYRAWMEAESDERMEDANHLWLRMSDAWHPNAVGHLWFFREMAGVFRVRERFGWE
jgi:lysophospholipase L1-like esterase